MTDPLGLIGQTSALPGLPPLTRGGQPEQPAGPSFQQTLRDQIAKVNELQQEAKEAVEDLASGRPDAAHRLKCDRWERSQIRIVRIPARRS